jgi:hypothetical protein
VAHGDVTDKVHGSTEGGAVGSLEDWVECCGDLAGAGSSEQDWGFSNSGVAWRHRAGAAPPSFSSPEARGTRGDFSWHCRGPVDPADCTWPWASTVDGEPGDQAQRRQPRLSCQPGGQECLATGTASQALSSGAAQGATMACGTEARAAMVTGADLRLAKAGVRDRPGHADIQRSIAVCSFRRVAC